MQDERDIEISIKDLFFYFARRWVQLLLAALVGFLLVGGLKYAMNLRADAAKEAAEAQTSEIPKEVYEEQKKLNTQLYNKQSNEREIAKQQVIIDQTGEYLQNSVLMRLDPYHKLSAVRRYLVTTGSGDSYEYFRDPADPIAASYAQVTVGAEDFAQLSSKYSVDPVYLQELVQCEADLDANTVVLTATGETAEMAQDVLHVAESFLLSKQEEIAARYGKHDIEMVFESQSSAVDSDLIEMQQTNRTALVNAQNALERAQNAVYDAEGQVRDLEKSVHELTEKHTGSPMKSSLKYAILGFLLGGCAMGGIYLLRYLFPSRLHTADEMKAYWDIPVLGVFDKQSNAKAFKALDQWFMKLNGDITGLKDETVISNVAVTLDNVVPAGTKLIVAGDADDDKHRMLSEALKGALSSKTISLTEAPDLLHSAAERSELAQSDAVLLIAERNKSTYQNMQELIDTTRVLGKKIIGCVVY